MNSERKRWKLISASASKIRLQWHTVSLTHCSFFDSLFLQGLNAFCLAQTIKPHLVVPIPGLNGQVQPVPFGKASIFIFNLDVSLCHSYTARTEQEDYCPKPLVGKLFPQLITFTVSDLVLIFCYISRFMSHLLPLARAYWRDLMYKAYMQTKLILKNKPFVSSFTY